MKPLAAQLRPASLSGFYGQEHLLAEGKPLAQVMSTGQLHSMILWGPPGTGKTTLAHLLCDAASARLEKISAVLAGVKDIRAAVARAEEAQAAFNQQTILFVDEVHRFNKSQQDAFLPYVEEGVVTFIGATTENPSFALNNALLSRARVYVLKALDNEALLCILATALENMDSAIDFPESLQEKLAAFADGDARRMLNLFEVIVGLAQTESNTVTDEILHQALGQQYRMFDKGGDFFYDQISALHKSVRGSSPDAALYWLARMLDAGCDPLYVARRVVRMASEDIGNADPRALELALNAWQVQERLGSPEGELAIAQAVVYCACAAKSNATYMAYKQAMSLVKETPSYDVPVHLRNAPTKLMKELGYGREYRYAHDEPNAYAAGECYFPDELVDVQFYKPVDRGLEIKIAEKLARLKQWDKA